MAGCCGPQVGDFALDPEIGECALHFRPQLCGKLTYFPDAPLCRLSFFEGEAELAGRVGEVTHNSSVYMRLSGETATAARTAA